MNYHDKNHDSEYRQNEQNGTMIGELIAEIPIVGELFESLGGGKIGRKGIRKIGCCCLPIALVLLLPIVAAIYWLAKSALSLINIDLTNINWIEQTKNWVINNFQLDQVTEWINQFQTLQGLLGQ